MTDKKVSKYIDGEKLYRDMTARYENLNSHIWRDFGGNQEPFYNKWHEIKFWKEALERGVYDMKEDEK